MALLPFISVVLALISVTQAQSDETLTIYQPPDTYSYHGCYNETTEEAGARALSGGMTEVREDEMTVSLCLDICTEDDEYEYAGLQWARECWCANSLSDMAEKIDDDQCDFACEGDEDTACGGRLRLSVYKRSGAQALGLPLWALVLCTLAVIV